MGRKHRNARRSSQVRQNKSSSSITRAIRDLTLVTQQYQPPLRPDVQRMRINHRQLYTFERATILNPGTGVQYLTFQLSNMPNSTEFTTLFAKYRILQITCEFPPNYTLGTGELNVLSSTIDTSGTLSFSPPSGESDLAQLDTYMRHPGSASASFSTAVVTRTFTPHFLQPTSDNVARAREWLSTANPDEPHYGLIINQNSDVALDLTVRFVVQFMNPI